MMNDEINFKGKDVRELATRIFHATPDTPGAPIEGKDLLILRSMLDAAGFLLYSYAIVIPALFRHLAEEDVAKAYMVKIFLEEFSKSGGDVCTQHWEDEE